MPPTLLGLSFLMGSLEVMDLLLSAAFTGGSENGGYALLPRVASQTRQTDASRHSLARQ